MSKITLNDLPALAEELSMNGELVESFLFACRLKNLTPKSMQGYGERIAYLMRWAATQGKDLDALTKHDLHVLPPESWSVSDERFLIKLSHWKRGDQDEETLYRTADRFCLASG